MRPVLIKIATLALALGGLVFVVVNASLSSSCAKPAQTAPRIEGNTHNALGVEGARFLPATKSGIIWRPRFDGGAQQQQAPNQMNAPQQQQSNDPGRP